VPSIDQIDTPPELNPSLQTLTAQRLQQQAAGTLKMKHASMFAAIIPILATATEPIAVHKVLHLPHQTCFTGQLVREEINKPGHAGILFPARRVG
jgi:hypothetical protein